MRYHCHDVIALTVFFGYNCCFYKSHYFKVLSTVTVTATVSFINHLSIATLICILMLEITVIKTTKKLLVTLAGDA